MQGFLPSVYLLWATSLVFHAVACWLVVKRNYFTHWRAFGCYLFFVAINSVVMFPLALFHNAGTLYAATYLVGDFIEAVLVSLVVLEILGRVLEPFESLPSRTVTRFCFWAVAGVCTTVVLSVVVPHPPIHDAISYWVDVPLTLERTIFLACAVVLWTILFQAKALGISWNSSLAEIAIGFVLYLTVQSTTRFVMGMYNTDSTVNLANEVAQFAYLIALASWIWTMTHRDPLPPRPEPEKLARLQELAKEDYAAVPKERIFAAVGIKVNTPDPAAESEEDQPAIEPQQIPAR